MSRINQPPPPPVWELAITAPRADQTFNPPASLGVGGSIVGPAGSSGRDVVVSSVSVTLDNGGPQPLSFTRTNPHAGPTAQARYSFTGTVGPILFDDHTITVTAQLSNHTKLDDSVVVIGALGICNPDVAYENWAGSAGIATGSVIPALTCTPHSLADIAQIVRDAEAAHMRVHAFNTAWSFSDAAITRDNMVNMSLLKRPIQKVQQALASGAPDPNLVYHVEAGISMRDLYQALDNFGYPPAPATPAVSRHSGILFLEVDSPASHQPVQVGPVAVTGRATVGNSGPAHPHSIKRLTVQLDNGAIVDETSHLEADNIPAALSTGGGHPNPSPDTAYGFNVTVQVTTLGSHTITVTVTDDINQSVAVSVSFLTAATRLALQTMTGSGTISLGGAISTGSHASDKLFELTQFMPPPADNVLAIHLVGVGGAQYWIEPSKGVTDPTKLAQLSLIPDGDPTAGTIPPENIIYDDSVFEAALVSFGCMGVIYALVLQVLPQYDLVETTEQTMWSAFKRQAVGKYLNDPNNRFLQVVINPYLDSDGDNSCLLITRESGSAAGIPLCTAGDPNQAVTDMVTDMVQSTCNLIEQADHDCNAWHLADMLQAAKDNGTQIQGLINGINYILEQAPELRPYLLKHYGNIMTAWWPPVTCAGASHQVMDTEQRGAPGPTSQTGGYSIEVSFPALDSDGQLAFTSLVDSLIALINGATNTFLGGWLSVRLTGATRAALGMQQWGLTCAIEISTLPNIDGELALHTLLLETMLAQKGLPHWGQLIDRSFPGHGSYYPRYQEWRNVYSRFSNNFENRTFENALSARWQLTTPEPVTLPVDVPALQGQTLANAKTIISTAPGNLALTVVQAAPLGTTVIGQRPLAGCRVPPGWNVTIFVA